nr:integrase, catalytic region, zinc finger, CCHC-type, peptidase aspartic, catalytic [Tanacetum cinerariifolium]
HETYKNVSQEIRDQLNAEAEAVQIILTRIDNDIYSTVDACPNACEMWKAIERLKQGESINVQDLETNLYWEFGKFTYQDGESLESYYSRFYKMMNELIRNQCKVTNHQVNVQFLLQLQPEWQRFVTLVKQSQEMKTVSYRKLYDILKQHQHEVNEITAEKIACVANPLALVAQQQPDKEIDKFMALISLSFKKIYKPTNNNLRNSFNTSRANQDNSPRINRNVGYKNQRIGNVARARETVEQADWRDDTDDDELEDHELEVHYMYMAQLQEVSPDAADFRPIFDDEPLQKVSNDDHYNVFAKESAHPKQSKPVHDTYPIEQDAQDVIIDSLDISYDREEIDQNDDDNDLVKERELLASLIEKLKCKINERTNHNKFLETSNKVLIEKLKGEIEDFKNKNKSLESSNNFFKEANNRLFETNNLLYVDYKKSEAELARRNSKEYALQMELECTKIRGDLLSYKMDYQMSCTKYTDTINALNQTILETKDKLSAHHETISILSQHKEAQIKLYKTREDKELDKVIELEHKVKVLDNIVYKTGQSVQTMNMLNNKCRTSFAKPEFLKKAQRANPRLYDIGCYNENPALMLAPDSDKVIRLEKESRSKLSDLIWPFDYDKLNNLYDLFVPQRQKSSEQRYFSERSRLSHININNGKSKETLSDLNLKLYKTQFLNEIDRLSREYYYADHMNAILGVYTELDEVNNLQCDYLELLEKCEGLETELLKSKMMSKSFESVQKHAINLKLELQQCKEKIKNGTLFKVNKTKDFCKEREQYFEIQDLKAQLQDKGIVIRMYKIHTDHNQTSTSQLPQDSRKTNKRVSFSTGVIPKTSVSRPQLKSNPQGDRVMHNNSQRKKQAVEDQRRSVKLSKNKTSVTACVPLCQILHCLLILLQLVEIVLFIIDSGCSKHMMRNLKLLINFVEKILGMVKFGNDQIAPILGYGDLNSSTRSQQAATWNRGKAIVNSLQPIYDQEPSMVAEDDKTSKDKEIDKLMDLISLSNAGYENQRNGNVAGARENVGSSVVQKSGIQCYNCKELGHVARECQKPKRAKDAAYH